MPKLTRIAPEVPVASLRASLDYYKHKLGFEIAMEMPGGDYAIVERDDVAIHLFQSDGPHSTTSFHVFAHGLDELHDELRRRGAQVLQGIARKAWGNRDFRVMDDSGNEIKFTEPI